MSKFQPPASLKAGVKKVVTRKVDAGGPLPQGAGRGTGFAWLNKQDICSTPSLVADMEYQCSDMIGEHLTKEQATVGVSIEFTHSAATPVGFDVTMETEVLEVKGRTVVSSVTVSDKAGKVAEGKHTRAIVETENMVKNVDKKKDQLSKL